MRRCFVACKKRTYIVYQKAKQFLFLITQSKWTDFSNFDTQNPEESLHQKIINLSISPVNVVTVRYLHYLVKSRPLSSDQNYLRIYWTDFHQIFTICKYLIVDYWSDPPFPIIQGTLPWQTNFKVKIGEIGIFIFIRRRGIPKRSGISQFRFQKVRLRWSGYIVWTLFQ